MGDTQSMPAVAVGFRSGGASVQFAGDEQATSRRRAGDEQVTCNGAPLPLRNRLAMFQVFRSPTARVAGTNVRCDHVANSTVASITHHISAAPAITSPVTGAQVAPRSRPGRAQHAPARHLQR